MVSVWLRWRTSWQRTSYLLLVVLAGVTLALAIGFGSDMTALFPLLSVVCGAIIPWAEGRDALPWPLVAVFVVACTSALVAWGQHSSAADIWEVWYGSALAGLIVAIIYRFIVAIGELRRTRQELARSAVDAERLRFARDLHDLLGHTLSVMVVKAQVVRKVATRDPRLAAEQAADIEEAGRRALAEVRQAVTGYRGRGLAGELDAARATLADASLTAIVRQDGPPIPDEAVAVLGWVVREGVTNVIKHSGGSRCEIDVSHKDGKATVEITDDGTGSAAIELPSGGQGLAGLTERIAADGGTLEAGPRSGGFRLAAEIPTLAREEVCG